MTTDDVGHSPSGTDKASRWKDRLAYLLVCALVWVLYLSGALHFAERKLDDVKFALLDRPATGNVVFVEIDAQSLSKLGIWPWPRRLHAAVIDRLLAAGARRIAFDVDFSAKSSPDEDARLAAALQRAGGKVILPVFTQKASQAAQPGQFVAAKPLAPFRAHAQLAALNVFPSSDGLVRDLYRSGEIAGVRYPSLSAALAAVADDARSAFAIDFGIDPATVPRLSYVDVLQGRFDPNAVAGKEVVVGSTAAELGDYFAVPAWVTIPGPLLHILGYESLVQGRALQRLGPLPVLLLVALLVLILRMAFEKRSFRAGLWTAIGTGSAVFVGSILIQKYLPIQIDTVPLVLVAGLMPVAAMANRVDRQSVSLLFQGLEIRRKNTMMRNLIDKSIVGVVIAGADGRIVSVNDAAAAMFGYEPGALEGATVMRLIPSLAWDTEADKHVLQKLAAAGRRELSGRRADGVYFPIEITANEVLEDGSAAFVAFINDITLRRRQEKELVFRADHDVLTSLPNRTKFSRSLEKDLACAVEKSAMVAVFLLDLDRFKEVNDTLGHAVGDRLLQDVSERLSRFMPEGALLSRFGGDEYAIYLPNVGNDAEVENFARSLLAQLKRPFEVDEITLEVGGSIGAALFPQDGASVDELLQRADIAMYGAKRNQSGFARYWAEDDVHSIRNLTLTGDLRRAIDNGELELAFQPKISLASGKISGAEVLCRWHRVGHGFVSPDEFIEHAEQSGLIFSLTQSVLGKAIEAAAIWRELGWDLNIAVNLSARLLHHEKILAVVTETLSHWDYPPDRLTIEITENALLVNPAHAMIVINELAALGINVSIDDFGTGYSSLSYLATLPASELKIDKSFVLGMDSDSDYRTIIKSVIGMAHDLKLRVVAEGVETQETMAELQRMGCDIGQGYLFGKPMAMADFEACLNAAEWGATPAIGQHRHPASLA